MPYPQLLPWYDLNKRILPFRGTHDPYAVWISEIMLQQTRTETVSGYFVRFMDRFPDIEALAKAKEEEVLKLWEGLGYYSRARNLHKAAKIMMDLYGGRFPERYEAIRALPGIGDYTAAAVSSIALRKAYPAIDGNLTRVLSRVHGIRQDTDKPETKKIIHDLGMEQIDRERPGDWNQAMMDLGATVCVPGTPDCGNCPLRELCVSCREGDAENLPVHGKAKPPVPVDVGVALVTKGNRVLVQKRDSAMLKGLWVFYLAEGDSSRREMTERLEKAGAEIAKTEDWGDARHVFTHRIWNMRLYHFECGNMPKNLKGQWVTAEELEALPLPNAMKAARMKIMEYLMNGERA